MNQTFFIFFCFLYFDMFLAKKWWFKHNFVDFKKTQNEAVTNNFAPQNLYDKVKMTLSIFHKSLKYLKYFQKSLKFHIKPLSNLLIQFLSTGEKKSQHKATLKWEFSSRIICFIYFVASDFFTSAFLKKGWKTGNGNSKADVRREV